jgi:hypothetical protein
MIISAATSAAGINLREFFTSRNAHQRSDLCRGWDKLAGIFHKPQ